MTFGKYYVVSTNIINFNRKNLLQAIEYYKPRFSSIISINIDDDYKAGYSSIVIHRKTAYAF